MDASIITDVLDTVYDTLISKQGSGVKSVEKVTYPKKAIRVVLDSAPETSPIPSNEYYVFFNINKELVAYTPEYNRNTVKFDNAQAVINFLL